MAVALLSAPVCSQEASDVAWEPFPYRSIAGDFGGDGLIQTPSARFAPDGQIGFTISRVYPYERYGVTVQATPWLEATLRYSSIANRLYSEVPEFSGNQSFKDRGLDLKLQLLGEGTLRPALAIGLRDFLGTGIFASEYLVGSKTVGPLDLSFGIGWGNLGQRGDVPNPLRLISARFRNRGGFTAGGGSLNGNYFTGERVAFFGGVRYALPIIGLTAVAEWDPNDYQNEIFNNRFKVDFPVNFGLSYQPRPWLSVGANLQRGNRIGLRLTIQTNLHNKSKVAKLDPPAPSFAVADLDTLPTNPPSIGDSATANSKPWTLPATLDRASSQWGLGEKLEAALGEQGALLLKSNIQPRDATLEVVQGRFRNVATGLGRVARAAFSVLPTEIGRVTIIFVEHGLPASRVTIYRHELANLLAPGGPGSSDEMWLKTEMDDAPVDVSANYVGTALRSYPRFLYAIRPGLRTTLGRPEQFILYQAWIRLNGSVEIAPGFDITGSFGVNVSNNFNQLKQPSDSILPHVRSDIEKYLKFGTTSIPYLQANYAFRLAPSLYGQIFGGMLEEMFGGVGGEILYQPFASKWAIGADISWVKQRDFEQYFGFQKYHVATGHVTLARYFEGPQITATIRAGRYLAKDVGATLQVSRRFRSGATVGGFITKTNLSAAEFGEGRFDKGLYVTIPLDWLYTRNVRSSVGLLWRPLIRDGGAQLLIRNPLYGSFDAASLAGFKRDWTGIDD